MRPWICVNFFSHHQKAPQSSWSILSVKVLSLTRCPWVSLVLSTTCWSSKLKHNILMHPFHMLGVAGVFGGSLFSAMLVHWLPPHWFVKPLRLSPRTTVTSSVKKKRPTTSSQLTATSVVSSSNTLRSTTHVPFTSSWQVAVIGIWFTALGVSTMAFNLNGFNFNQSIVESQGKVINTWAMSSTEPGLGMEVMHERNTYNFPLDLAAESTPVELDKLLPLVDTN